MNEVQPETEIAPEPVTSTFAQMLKAFNETSVEKAARVKKALQLSDDTDHRAGESNAWTMEHIKNTAEKPRMVAKRRNISDNDVNPGDLCPLSMGYGDVCSGPCTKLKPCVLVNCKDPDRRNVHPQACPQFIDGFGSDCDLIDDRSGCYDGSHNGKRLGAVEGTAKRLHKQEVEVPGEDVKEADKKVVKEVEEVKDADKKVAEEAEEDGGGVAIQQDAKTDAAGDAEGDDATA